MKKMKAIWSREGKKNAEARRRRRMKAEVTIQELKNKNGQQRSIEECKLILVCVNQLINENVEEKEAIERTAQLLHVGRSKIKELIEMYDNNGEVKVSMDERRSHRVYTSSLQLTHVSELQQFIVLNHSQGKVCTITQMIDHLLEIYKIEFTHREVRNALHRSGYVWGELEAVPTPRLSESRVARLRKFVIQYAEALKLERDGSHIVVYMDETYCHTNYSSQQTWFHPEIHTTTELIRPSGKGTRMIVVHAISGNGVVDWLLWT